MIQDFESSGLIDMAAKGYRVVVFDRPGFGHSGRPHTVVWTPEAQAELINTALNRLGISTAIILGHSWGASVAIAVVIAAGEKDRVVDIETHSARLHRDVPQSKFLRLPGLGHMIHQSDPDAVLAAINELAEDCSATKDIAA